MNNTDDLIVRLSKEASAVQPVRMSVWGGVIVSVLLVYGIGAQVYLGIRPDILSSLMKLAYVIEIILLAALALSGAFASIHALYPDMYQRSWVAKLPFFILGILSLFLVYQGLMDNPSMDMAFLLHENGAGMQCTLCIAALAIIPSALLFAVLRKGASTHPLQAGLLAAMTAASIGCFVLRLEEQSDSTAHFIIWHYIPTLFFSGIGAGLGKLLLRW